MVLEISQKKLHCVEWEIKLEGEGLIQRIVKLDLENLGIDTIPFSIGGLEHLKWIELDRPNSAIICNKNK